MAEGKGGWRERGGKRREVDERNTLHEEARARVEECALCRFFRRRDRGHFRGMCAHCLACHDNVLLAFHHISIYRGRSSPFPTQIVPGSAGSHAVMVASPISRSLLHGSATLMRARQVTARRRGLSPGRLRARGPETSSVRLLRGSWAATVPMAR